MVRAPYTDGQWHATYSANCGTPAAVTEKSTAASAHADAQKAADKADAAVARAERFLAGTKDAITTKIAVRLRVRALATRDATTLEGDSFEYLMWSRVHHHACWLYPQRITQAFRDREGHDPTPAEVTVADIESTVLPREQTPGLFVWVPRYPRGYIAEVLDVDREMAETKLNEAFAAQAAARESLAAALTEVLTGPECALCWLL